MWPRHADLGVGTVEQSYRQQTVESDRFGAVLLESDELLEESEVPEAEVFEEFPRARIDRLESSQAYGPAAGLARRHRAG